MFTECTVIEILWRSYILVVEGHLDNMWSIFPHLQIIKGNLWGKGIYQYTWIVVAD